MSSQLRTSAICAIRAVIARSAAARPTRSQSSHRALLQAAPFAATQHGDARRTIATTVAVANTASTTAIHSATPGASVAPAASTAGGAVAAAAVPPPPPSDAGAEFEYSDSDADKPTTWRRNVFLLALCGGIGFHIYSQRKEFALVLNRDAIGCLPTEIHELINVFHFGTKDLESLYAKTMQRFPRGELSLEDFAVLLAQQVALVKARRKRERELREKERQREQYLEDREEVQLERRIARTPDADTVATLKSQLEELVARHQACEAVREKAAAADTDEAGADAHKDNEFFPIDTYVFFRTCTPKSIGMSSGLSGPPQRTKLLDVRDLFLGLSNLVFDHADLEEQLKARQGQKNIPTSLEELQRTWGSRDVEVFTRTPQTKLHFAFRVTDEDRDGHITLAEAERMIARLVRTGHVTPDSIMQHQLSSTVADAANSATPSSSSSSPAASPSRSTTAFLPYVYEQRTASQIARGYWHEIAHQRRVAALQQRETLLATAPSTPPSELPSLATPPYEPVTKISWAEFLAASRHFTDSHENVAFWYLNSTYPNGSGTGGFYRWRHRRINATKHMLEAMPTAEEAKDIDKNIETFLV